MPQLQGVIFAGRVAAAMGAKGKRKGTWIMTLDQLKIGRRGRIISVNGKGALRDRLLDMGLTPGTEVMVRRTAPFGDPIEIHLRGYELTLRLEDANNIEVERVKS